MVKYLSSYIFEIRNRDIVPCATENIAVVDDNDSRILKFKISAVIDDVDITDKILAIRYVNALGQFDTFFSDTREVKNDGEKKYIIFPWYLSQKATAASGTLTYDISIYDGHITDAAEEGQYILHTKPQVLNIEKGLLDVGSASKNPDAWTDAIATFQKIIGSYHDDAINAAEAAKKSENNAKASEINAESYKNAAAVSASNAAASEANANAYKDAAAASAESIRQSEINTHNYQIAAQNSAQAAATSEAKAKQSEQNAATSETNAADSANKAKASETNAASSAAEAATSEAHAKTSETNAAKSETNAKTSENAAAASASAAKTSETNAKTSETNAANTLAGALKLSGGTMTGDITMSGDAKFVGNLTGNADTATTATNANHATSAGEATNDGDGNNIANTYGKISAVAGYHNSIFRGNDITSKFTDGSLFTAISASTFNDLYIGDYFIATCNGVSTKWRLAGFDIYYRCGDTQLTRHHAVVIPDNALMRSNMNNDHVTTGSYVGSRMYTEVLPGLSTQISNMVGSSHLIKYRDLFANATTNVASGGYSGWTGASSSWAWYDCTIRLCSEVDVYGTRSFSSSGYDIGMACVQLPLFRLSPDLRIEANRDWWWLSAVAYSVSFCGVSGDGYANLDWASGVGGVRPRFLIG